MLSQLRRDPVLGAQAAIWIGVVALNTGVLAGLVTTLATGSNAWLLSHGSSLLLLSMLIWFSTSLFLLSGKVKERCLTFDLALPIPANKLWLSHVISLSLLCLGFLVVTAGVLNSMFWLFRNSSIDFSGMRRALADLIFPTGACLILVVILLQRARPGLRRIPGTGRYFIYSAAIMIAALGVVLGLSALPAPVSLLPFAVAILLGYLTHRSVPPAFTIVPIEADSADWDRPDQARDISAPAGAQSRDAYPEAGPMGVMGSAWFLFRTFFVYQKRKGLVAVLYFPLFLSWGWLLSGFLLAWKGIEFPQFAYTFLTGFLLFSLLPTQVNSLPLMDPLPISRRAVFASMMLPGIVAMALGLGGGSIGALNIERSRLQIKYQKEDSRMFPPYRMKVPMIRVPAQYGGIAWDGRVPQSGSPWGESHPAWTYPLYRGSRIMIYSPFNTPEGCSPQFAALQISRAIRAVYGATVPYEEILDRYLEVADGKSYALRGGGAPLFEAYPGLKPQGEIAMFPVLLTLVCIAWLLLALIYLRWCRAGVSQTGRMKIFFVMALAVIATTAGQLVVMITGLFRLDVGAAFVKILMHRIATGLPGGSAAIWLFSALVILGCYRLAEAEFQRIEVLPGRVCR